MIIISDAENQLALYRQQKYAWETQNPLKVWRSGLHLFQADISGTFHVSLPTISAWETGKSLPSDTYWPIITEVLGIKDVEDVWKAWYDKKPVFGGTDG